MKRCFVTMKCFKSIRNLVALAGAGLIAWTSVAENIPVPSAGIDGPEWTWDPFNFPVDPNSSSRYQQVYSASAFSLINEHGGWITGLFWASDLFYPEGGWFAELNTEVSCGITTREPDQLSSHFDENMESASTTVRARGPLLLVSGGRGSRIDLQFEQPFFYSPSAGNLLLEIRTYIRNCCFGIPRGPFDAYNTAGDAVSRVLAYDVNATSGIPDTLGLTTYFLVTPVPGLTISLQSSNVVLRWPVGPNEFVLEQSPQVANGAVWQASGGTLTTNGTNREVILPLDPRVPTTFFRLASRTNASQALVIEPASQPIAAPRPESDP